jgi:hypothetical protein
MALLVELSPRSTTSFSPQWRIESWKPRKQTPLDETTPKSSVIPLLPRAGIGRPIGDREDVSSTSVVPARYAFAIWAPIFAGSIGYALRLSTARESDGALRAPAPYAALAFGANAVWELVVQSTDEIGAPPAILAVGLAAALGGVRVARRQPPPDVVTRVLLAIATDVLAGWSRWRCSQTPRRRWPRAERGRRTMTRRPLLSLPSRARSRGSCSAPSFRGRAISLR